MTMLTPNDPGSGRLFFWSKQGISLQQLLQMVADMIAAGGIVLPPGSGSGGGSGDGGGGGGTYTLTEDPLHPGLYILTSGGVAVDPGTGGGGGTVVVGNVNAIDILDSTDVGRSLLTAPGTTFAARQLFARTTINAVGVGDVPTLVSGLLQWSQMPAGSMAFMESTSGVMIARRTARDDILGIWRFPAGSPPSLGGGLNAHDGDEWWVEISA